MRSLKLLIELRNVIELAVLLLRPLALATPPPAYALEVARRSDVAFEQQQLYNPPPPVTSYQQQVC